MTLRSEAVFLGGPDPQSRSTREFLRLRGIEVEEATESFRQQFPGCQPPTLFVGGQAFEGPSGIRVAVDLYLR